jgi:hypothetical protein
MDCAGGERRQRWTPHNEPHGHTTTRADVAGVDHQRIGNAAEREDKGKEREDLAGKGTHGVRHSSILCHTAGSTVLRLWAALSCGVDDRFSA